MHRPLHALAGVDLVAVSTYGPSAEDRVWIVYRLLMNGHRDDRFTGALPQADLLGSVGACAIRAERGFAAALCPCWSAVPIRE